MWFVDIWFLGYTVWFCPIFTLQSCTQSAVWLMVAQKHSRIWKANINNYETSLINGVIQRNWTICQNNDSRFSRLTSESMTQWLTESMSNGFVLFFLLLWNRWPYLIPRLEPKCNIKTCNRLLLNSGKAKTSTYTNIFLLATNTSRITET